MAGADINQENVYGFRARSQQAASPTGGGFDGGSGDMRERVDALEKGVEKILDKLDGISKSIDAGKLENEKRFGAIEGRLTGIEAKLEAKANKADLGPVTDRLGILEGNVRALPGVPAMITLVFGTVTLCLAGVAGLSFTLAKSNAPSAQPAMSSSSTPAQSAPSAPTATGKIP